MPASTPVLISGAGPTGLVAALTLLQNGISVRIIEKEDGPRPGQRGTGNYPRTLEAYHFLGVSEVFKTMEPIRDWQSHSWGSVDVLKQFPFMEGAADPTPAIPFNTCWYLGQRLAEGILDSHLTRLGCSVEYGKELVSFEQKEGSVVAQILSKDGHTETVESQFLIGADGARGIVRKQLGLTFLGETRDTTRVVTGDMRFRCLELSKEARHHFSNKDINVVLYFTRQFGDNDGWQFHISGDNFDAESLHSSKKALYSCIRDAVGVPIEFVDVVWISTFRPNIRMVDKFGQGRVFVAGDAAHAHSFTGGQGVNSGVQDSFNLAWKMALVLKGTSPPSLLETFTTERLPVIAQMLDLTTTILNKTWGPKQASADNAWRRGRILFMLGVNYRASPIVLDEFSADIAPVPAYGVELNDQLVAGDRAPDAPGLLDGEHSVRLFDLFKPTHHTALVFAPSTEAADESARALAPYYEAGVCRTVVVVPAGSKPSGMFDTVKVLADEDGYAHAHYFARDSPRIVIVRPDGVIGAIVAGPSGVEKYFGLIVGHQ